MPPMYDPNDDRTDEERYAAGCGTIIAYIVGVMLALLLCGLLGSCSTSKSACGVTTAEGDSLTQLIEQTASVARKDTSVAQSAQVFNSSAVETTTADETETETINEQITETTDSLGNRTVTTNRTTTRQRKLNTSTQSLLDQYREEIATQMHLSYLDSLSGVFKVNVHTHWADSMAVKEEKHSDTGSISIIATIVDWLFRIVGLLIIAALVYMTVRYYKGK